PRHPRSTLFPYTTLFRSSCSRPARADLPSRTTYHNAANYTNMMEKHYRCWAEIDRSALRHNVAFVREKFGPDIDLIAVVKANARSEEHTSELQSPYDLVC